MADQRLESFKIGDVRRPIVGARTKQAEPEHAEAASSLGFRRIEGILEREDPAQIRRHLGELRDRLMAREKGAQANKERAAAKRAALAVERTAELIDFLFKTKESLTRGGAK